MIKTIINIIIGILAGFVAAFGVYKKGKSDGINESEMTKIKNDLENDRQFFIKANKQNQENRKMSRSELISSILRGRY